MKSAPAAPASSLKFADEAACVSRVSAVMRQWRKEQKRKMAEVARKLGVATSTLGNWEKGGNLPMGQNLFLVADLMKIHVHCLHCPKVERRALCEKECPSLRP